MLLQLLYKIFGPESGIVTKWLLVDIVLFYLIILTLRKIVFPVIRNYRLGRLLCKLCGTDGDKHWFYGHSNKYNVFDKEGILNIVERTKTFPYMFCAWIGPFLPIVEFSHPDTLAPGLLHNSPKNDLGYRFVRPWLGDGLVTSYGKKWKRNRRLLTPAFHYTTLKQYLKIFNDSTRLMLDIWEKEIGNPVNINKGISLMTLDVILQCAMSMKTDCQNLKSEHPYIEALKHLASTCLKRCENPFYIFDWIFYKTSHGRIFKESLDVVHKQAEKLIIQRQKMFSQTSSKADANCEGTDKKMDFLDILLQAKDEDGEGLTDLEIRDEVNTFLFGGYDTTACAISWLFYNLAKHPELQEKCRKEIKEVLGERADVEWNDLSNIQYCTMCIKESLRLYPSIFSVGRYLNSPLSLKKDLTIPPNCNMTLHIFACHRNELVWDDPERFDPERFTLENVSKRSSYAYVPFSAGPRNCIGQNFAMNEIKVVLCQALKKYRFYLDSDTPTPILKPRFVLESESGIFLKYELL